MIFFINYIEHKYIKKINKQLNLINFKNKHKINQNFKL